MSIKIYMDNSQLILGLKIAVIFVAVLLVFGQDLAIVAADALQNEATSYILAVPFLFAYLVYRKRKMLRTVVPLESQGEPRIMRYSGTIAGVLLSSTAILVYWYGSYTFTPLEYHMLMLPVFAAGLTLVLFNTQTLRQLLFPLVFLVLLMPPPSDLLSNVGSALSVSSSQVSFAFIRLVGIPSTLTSQYGNPVIQLTRAGGETMGFSVGIACSGIYSLLGFLVFAVFIGYIIRDKLWKKLTLFFIGFALIYVLNVARIDAILMIGFNYGQDIATELFHLVGGWILIFLGTLLLLAFSEKALHTKIFSRPPEGCSECNSQPKTDRGFCFTCGRILKPAPIALRKRDLAKIVAIIIVPILLMSIEAPVFALTRGPPIVVVDTPAGQKVSLNILPTISGYNLSFSYRDQGFETVAHEDMALLYYYAPANQSQETVYAAFEIASSQQNLYSWETCVATGQIYPFGHQEASQIELKDVQLLQNPPLIGRFFVFQYTATNVTQAVLYWFESTTFQVNSTSEQKYIKISLITYPESLADLPALENQTVALATTVASYWEPIVTWSQLALFLSLNGSYFAAATFALLLVVTILYVLERRKQRRADARVYQKLSTRSRQIIDTVQETEKANRPTLGAIAAVYKSKTGEPIDYEEVLHRLSEAERTGIIEDGVANVQDEPTQVWKSHLKAPKENGRIKQILQQWKPRHQ
ncbi:MAG: exosortase/archaeosortase family protein [Candidatus Bathyarchaeia archaeon]